MRETPEDRAKALVEQIVADLNDRKGLRQQWDMIDEEIQDEIIEAWREIALKAMTGDTSAAD